jgi:hypothetical protein
MGGTQFPGTKDTNCCEYPELTAFKAHHLELSQALAEVNLQIGAVNKDIRQHKLPQPSAVCGHVSRSDDPTVSNAKRQ